ncbi:MAG: sialate O-acetylesterase [Terrimicrobiaceae bacterium]
MRSAYLYAAALAVAFLALVPNAAQSQEAGSGNTFKVPAKPSARIPGGNNGNNSDAVPFQMPVSNAEFEIYLLMGQSNMLGRDTSMLAEQVDNPRIGAMDGNGNWSVGREPMWGGSGTGPGLSFAAAILSTRPAGIKIGLVPCAVGGTRLESWVKGGNLYASALARAKDAMKCGTLKGVIWHQGESDSNRDDTASSYGTRLAGMITDLRADLGIPDLPIVVGQLGSFLNGRSDMLFVGKVCEGIRNIPSMVNYAGFADSTNLTDRGDKVHFNAASEIEFGKRFAEAMLKVQGAHSDASAPK